MSVPPTAPGISTGLLNSRGSARNRAWPAISMQLQPGQGLLPSVAGPISLPGHGCHFQNCKGQHVSNCRGDFGLSSSVSRVRATTRSVTQGPSVNACVNERVGEGVNEALSSRFPDKDSVWLTSSFHLKTPGSFLTPLMQEVNSSAFQLSKQ